MPSRPATDQASPSTSGKGTRGRPSWTLPSGPWAAAGSACRSRAAGTPWSMASGTSKPRDGREEKPSPLCQTWDAAMSLREDIIDLLGDTCCYVIAALLFPDMEPDPAIAAAARRSSVKVLWGTDNLMNRLAEFAARKAYYPPNAEDIRRETAAVTDGQVRYAEEGPDQGHREEPQLPPEQPEAPAAPRLEVPAGGITIGHVDTLIVHTAPGSMPDVVKGVELGS